MKTTEIQATFAALLESFEPIIGQPTDADLTRLEFSTLSVLAPISFDEELGIHNLMGLLLSRTDYSTRHNNEDFPDYSQRPPIYDDNIDADATAGVRAKAEAQHQAKLNDWRVYDCAQRELRAFIVASIEDTWIRELRDPITGYGQIQPKDIMTHLWASCRGLHSLDLLTLRTSMLTMHVDAMGIPEYINDLEDAKKRSARGKGGLIDAFTDNYLMQVATAAMLKTQRYTSTMDKWDALAPHEQIWSTWKTMFKDAENKEKIRMQATGGKDQFGAAHRAAEDEAVPVAPPSAPPFGNTQGDSLDEYFDALAAAASTDQNVLAELVTSVTKLTASNANLVDSVSKLTKANEALTAKLNKAGGGRGYEGRDPRPKKLCPHCKRMTEHPPDKCYELEKNKSRRPRGWVSCL